MSEQTALLIIDMQIASFEVPGNPTYREAALLANIGELLRKAHAAGSPVIYIQHQEKSGSLVPGTRGWQNLPAIAPSEHDLIVPKYAEDAFLATTLEDELRTRTISHLVICGSRSDFCVDTTCRSAISHGYEVTLDRKYRFAAVTAPYGLIIRIDSTARMLLIPGQSSSTLSSGGAACTNTRRRVRRPCLSSKASNTGFNEAGTAKACSKKSGFHRLQGAGLIP